MGNFLFEVLGHFICDNKECYFQIDDNLLYKAQRSFNSYVKSKTLENIIADKLYDKNDTNWVIDLAAGKGQDLARLNNLNFKNGLFIDKDKNALLELVNRKFTLKSISPIFWISFILLKILRFLWYMMRRHHLHLD